MNYLVRASVLALGAAIMGASAAAQVYTEQLPAREQLRDAPATPPSSVYLPQIPRPATFPVVVPQVPPGAAVATARREAERRAEDAVTEAAVAEAAVAEDERPVIDLRVYVARLVPDDDPAGEGEDAADAEPVSPVEGFNVMQLPSVGRGSGLTLSE